MIKVLLLDLDGVLRHWDASHAATVETTYGLPPGVLTRAAYDPARFVPALTGAVDDRTWRDSVVAALAVEHGDVARDAVTEWMLPAGRVDPDVLEVVRRARTMARVILLTNATSRLHDDLERLGLVDEVDGVVSSADLGLAKPDPDAFSRAALRHHLMFSEIAYVDASRQNIATAEILGITSHLYEDVEGLSTFVDEVLTG
ncbi:HAD family hydrolase [Knoellia aerolata]|uniref:HAD family hydrolase n=1 Tax=Knoellia aerolata TaxID=442954 RepID=UPI0005665BEA|nr:HAD-IA family hydrolase [Knoellia aerolata]